MVRVAAIVLAGGLSTRFGGSDKAMLSLSGRSMAVRVVDIIAPQVDEVAINRDSPIDGLNLKAVPDLSPEKLGPIAGIEAGLLWAEGLEEKADYLLTVPVDTPYLPDDLVTKMMPCAEMSGAAIAITKQRIHPTISLHKIGAFSQSDIQEFYNKSLRKFWASVGAQEVLFDNEEAFININSDADLAQLDSA